MLQTLKPSRLPRGYENYADWVQWARIPRTQCLERLTDIYLECCSASPPTGHSSPGHESLQASQLHQRREPEINNREPETSWLVVDLRGMRCTTLNITQRGLYGCPCSLTEDFSPWLNIVSTPSTFPACKTSIIPPLSDECSGEMKQTVLEAAKELGKESVRALSSTKALFLPDCLTPQFSNVLDIPPQAARRGQAPCVIRYDDLTSDFVTLNLQRQCGVFPAGGVRTAGYLSH